MSYSIQMVRKSEQVSNEWSGGVTTQLAIYPEHADYSKRDFKWRMSSAMVEVEESVFTPLPGIWRLIMVVDGEMTLEHEGHHRIHLKPYEQDSFSGGWTTRSAGKVRDFNLMLAEGCSGELKAMNIGEEVHHEELSDQHTDFLQAVHAFYCTNGHVNMVIDEKDSIELAEGDLIILNRENLEKNIHVKLLSNSESGANVIRASALF
ncbi:HutD family protein [Bacillus sp. B190/17]|uniref:HutD family protein n=1 Tax=Bacillus lumedeiriae TaxID=3058829 RepID=A0ABW8IB94_9BACI